SLIVFFEYRVSQHSQSLWRRPPPGGFLTQYRQRGYRRQDHYLMLHDERDRGTEGRGDGATGRRGDGATGGQRDSISLSPRRRGPPSPGRLVSLSLCPSVLLPLRLRRRQRAERHIL